MGAYSESQYGADSADGDFRIIVRELEHMKEENRNLRQLIRDLEKRAYPAFKVSSKIKHLAHAH